MQQINTELLKNQKILEILLQAEKLGVQADMSPFDGFSKLATITSRCGKSEDNRTSVPSTLAVGFAISCCNELGFFLAEHM